MLPTETSSDLFIFASAVIVSFISAIVPLVNMEVYVVLLGGIVEPRMLPIVLLVATLSHMGGKTAIYYASSAFEKLPEGRFKERIRSARAQAERHSNLGTAVVFTSSLIGLPPLYLITVVCGALRFPFLAFFAAAFIGRIIRFAAFIWLPQLVRYSGG